MGRVVTAAVAGYTAFALLNLAVTASGVDNLAALMVGLFLSFACLGLVVPSTMVLALDNHGPIAGLASALGGTLMMLTGGVMIVLASVFFNGTALPMVAIIALCAVGALILSYLTLVRRREPEAVPGE
jgi:DHA1 family bicyclomycin/chloramphenicol resistance-like MFS transporter